MDAGSALGPPFWVEQLLASGLLLRLALWLKVIFQQVL